MYTNLIAKMEEKKISKRDIQKQLDIHYNSVSNKFSHKTCFTIDEAIKIQEHFFPECELGKLFKVVWNDLRYTDQTKQRKLTETGVAGSRHKSLPSGRTTEYSQAREMAYD